MRGRLIDISFGINRRQRITVEFERDFRDYCQKTFGEFGTVPEYFSLLRPLSEWQIAREFVKYPQYFGVFQSCNLGSKTNVWCCNCAKCLYVYILLAAFLDDDTLCGIFGCNMLEKTELSEMFAKSHELEDEIRKKLGAIGYEI